MTKKGLIIAVAGVTLWLTAGAQVGPIEGGLDLRSTDCAYYNELIDAQDGRAEVAHVWLHGYVTGLRGMNEQTATKMYTVEDINVFVAKLATDCRENPDKLLAVGVRELR